MSAETTEGNHELDRLRITRSLQRPRRARNPVVSATVMLLAVALVGAVGFLVYTRTLGRPLTVQTIMVQARHGAEPAVLLTGSGYIVTRHKYITIGTKILGQIVAEPIEEGQHVKVGDVLARIEDRDYQAQLRQAIAVRDVAAANLRLKLSHLDRVRKLQGTGGISEDDFDTAVNGADVAKAEIQRDAAVIEFAKFQVDQCTISSPINGIVLRKYRELGDTINFGGQIQTGGGATDIVQLADTEDMRAEVDINEAEIAKVAMGSAATVVPDAYPNRRFNASLVKIYPAADRQKGTVKIEVRIDKPDLQVTKPEMSVKVSFLDGQPVAGNEPLLIIPKDAVRADGGETYVWAMRGGLARRVPIVRGRDVESGVEVRQGLKDGDILVLAPPANLSDGLKVFVAH